MPAVHIQTAQLQTPQGELGFNAAHIRSQEKR